ncbi:MAG: hypothetical protein P1V51_01835 [Deltaproteobacteria bacterium]|nr:hypothetical protein [Deltaproteobacteria bacterium]
MATGLAVLCAALPQGLRAEEKAREAARIRIAVTDFAIRADDPSKGLEGLGLVVAAHLESRTGAEVITPADVAALLDLEGQRQILGCDDSAASCLAEIGGALGANYVLSGQIARIGSKYVVSLSLIDVAGSTIAGRTTKTANDEDGVLDAASAAADELAAVIVPGAGVTRIDPAPPKRRGGLLRTGSMIGGGALALGGLALMGSGYATYAGRGTPDAPEVTYSQAQAADTRWGVGIGLAAGGAALLVGSFLMPKGEKGAAMGLAPMPNGLLFVAEVW